jgi:hypothetical protein
MKIRDALALLCVIGAVTLGANGQDGWGWFLFAALVLV